MRRVAAWAAVTFSTMAALSACSGHQGAQGEALAEHIHLRHGPAEDGKNQGNYK
jgi:hypothetical protein